MFDLAIFIGSDQDLLFEPLEHMQQLAAYGSREAANKTAACAASADYAQLQGCDQAGW